MPSRPDFRQALPTCSAQARSPRARVLCANARLPGRFAPPGKATYLWAFARASVQQDFLIDDAHLGRSDERRVCQTNRVQWPVEFTHPEV